MKTALVICSLNATQSGRWEETLRQIAGQSQQPDCCILADSESGDRTVEIFRRFDWQVQTVPRREFNHGATRRDILCRLARDGFDLAVFVSQDVVLENCESLRALTDYLVANQAAAVYGRQLSRQTGGLDNWQRQICYPAESMLKTKADIPKKGLMTAFCSDAFCVWDIAKAIRHGNFPDTDFGEDMLLAARCILGGETIGYAAAATCWHEHPASLPSLFRRGCAIGRMHAQNPWLKANFGNFETAATRKIKYNADTLKLLPAMTVKYAGILFGKYGSRPWSFPVAMFVLLWLIVLPFIFSSDIPQSDTANRYAPMAEFFAKGDWDFAFHPRIAPLFPVISGLTALVFQVSGFTACKIAGALMLSLSIFPLWGLLKALYNQTVAEIGVVMLMVCSHLLRMGYSGLRESTSVFCLLLTMYALVKIAQNRRSLRHYLTAGVALGLLLLSRGDMLLTGALSGMLILGLDAVKNKLPWRSLATATTVLLLIAPYLFYNYYRIGYPALDVRYAALMRAVEQKYDINLGHHPSPDILLDIRAVSLEGSDDD